MTNWIQDWFGSEYYSILYKHRDCDEAKLFIDNLISLLNLPRSSRILDCGCGRGRHSIYLSEKGFEVTGIDISETNISYANERETRHGARRQKNEKGNLTFYVHDMRNLFRGNHYDAAINLFTSFGYFEKDSENNKTITSTCSALKKSGWLILDFMNTEKKIKELVCEEKINLEGINFSIKRIMENNFIVKQIEVDDNGKKYSFSERVKSYKRKELENFFVQNNMEVVHLFGDYDLHIFNKATSERLILIGRKN